MFRTSSNFDKLLDKATSNLRLEPDWPTILQICDLIRQGDVFGLLIQNFETAPLLQLTTYLYVLKNLSSRPKQALVSIKRKLTNSNPHIALFGLLVLESCVKNCGSLIHDEIGTKQYMEQLRELVKTSPHENVRTKILELIQAWAFAFRNSPKYRAVQDTVNIMKAESYKFPTLKESDAMFSADTAPEWADGDVCHRCRVPFGMVQRKHHCRACGQVFCGQCSSKASTLPKYGIEKEVRVCEACYDQVNKPTVVAPKETDLPAEYLSSSLAQQQQVPPRKTAEELREEEDLQLALALSQSEAEHKEKEKKRVTSSLKSNPIASMSRATYSPPPSPQGTSPARIKDEEEEVNPELAKYLNRKYWEQRQTVIEEHSARSDVASPSAPNISSPMPQKIIMTKQQNGEIDTQMEDFVGALRSQVEIFVNRMKSNSSRGRSIANDSSVQTLFMNITAMHSRLLRYIQEQDDGRVYYEGLQDKLAQMKDARAALDALREEHREKLRRHAEEAERQRQLQMAHKLEIMRKKKQEYLQYQRQLALQRIQEQEREMQMRQEQQKQQYILGSYQPVPGFMGPPTQGSPAHHVQYQGPVPNYNPMSPTNQGVYMYGQPPMNQYPIPGYGMQAMGPPPHMMGPMGGPEQQGPPEQSLQGRDNMGRLSISGPGMMQQMPGPPLQQHQQAGGGHQMGPPGHMPSLSGPANQIVPPQGPQSHGPIPQGPHSHGPGPQGPQSHGPIPQGPQSHGPLPQGPQGHGPIPQGPQGHGPIPQVPQSHGPIPQGPNIGHPPQGPGPIQGVPVTNGGPRQPSHQPSVQQGPSLPQMQNVPQMSSVQGPPMQYQPAVVQSAPPENIQAPQQKQEQKPDTAELISFD